MSLSDINLPLVDVVPRVACIVRPSMLFEVCYPLLLLLTSVLTLVGALSETLHIEISPFGLRSIVFEPGYIRTSFLSPQHTISNMGKINDYKELSAAVSAGMEGTSFLDRFDNVSLVAQILMGNSLEILTRAPR